MKSPRSRYAVLGGFSLLVVACSPPPPVDPCAGGACAGAGGTGETQGGASGDGGAPTDPDAGMPPSAGGMAGEPGAEGGSGGIVGTNPFGGSAGVAGSAGETGQAGAGAGGTSASGAGGVAGSISVSLTTSKPSYTVGDEVLVFYAGLPGWAGERVVIANTGAPAEEQVQSLPLPGSTQGIASFFDLPAGTFVARAFLSGNQLAAESAPFSVMPGANPFCGDEIRQLNEECDAGVSGNDLCSPSCRVRDALLMPEGQTLGAGRHPAAMGDSGGGVVSLVFGENPVLQVHAFSTLGVVQGVWQVASSAPFEAHPGVAALPGGRLVVAWSDLLVDGDERGIALRWVDPGAVEPLGPLKVANSAVDFSQFDPDLIWTGSELVVAWTDNSSLDTKQDLKFRIFDSALEPLSEEQFLAATEEIEGSVTLATFAGGWAAAWRSSFTDVETGVVAEKVHIQAGATHWTFGPLAPGSVDDKPALVELDAEHLLVVVSEAASSDTFSSGLRVAVLSLDTPGEVSSSFWEAAGVSVSPSQPALARVSDRFYLSWRTDSSLGDVNAEELWLREVELPLAGSDPTGWNTQTWPLPRANAHRAADQRRPVLVGNQEFSSIFSFWEDFGLGEPGSSSKQRIRYQLAPVPVLRVEGEGGQ